MNRKNATLNALFTSVISLLLCVSMLVGTTFAWFTDSVESGVNTIAAGNLDVELYYGKNADKQVKGDTKLFTDVNGEEIKHWEPGVVAYTNLKVANVGSLALKYQMSVNSTEMNYYVDDEGVQHTLAEALKVAVVKTGVTGTTREAVIAEGAEAGWNGLESFTLSGVLEGDTESETYGIVVYWEPGDNDNLFNMNNGKETNDRQPLSITLGVNLFATQEMYENDSFGPDYDGAAPWVTLADTDWYFADPKATEFTINSAEELAGLAAIVNGTAVNPVATVDTEGETTFKQDSFEGKTIKLGGNIDLAGHEWTPIGNWNDEGGTFFEGTFDGQGYTISNLYINEPAGDGVGLFGAVTNATIKGINVNNVNVTGYQAVGTVAGYAYSGCTISDCHVTGSVSLTAEYAYVGGIMAYGYVDIDNCSVIADVTGKLVAKERNAVGGITAWMLEGDNQITNCQVKNLDMTGWANIGGVTGFIHCSNVIDKCSAENINITKTRVDGHPSVGMAAGGFSYNGSKASTISNSTFSNITFNGSAVFISSADLLWGSEYGGSTSNNFVTENITKSAITSNLIYVSEIKTVEDLTNALATGGNYVLKNDLALAGTVTVPSGVKVTLYMNGKTITGTMSGTGNQDLFLVKGNLTVKNGTVQLSVTQNQGWNAMSTIFDITAGGVVNLDNVVANNKGGTDMNFVAHLNNWGEVTLNVENSTLEATYIPVRVFNSGNDMNNVTIKDTTLTGKYCYWVHNYTLADFGGSQEKVDAHKALLNVKIFNNGNTFNNSGKAPVLYGFTDTVYYNAEGKQTANVATMAELNAALKAGAKEIDAKGANLGDFYYSAKFTDGAVIKNAKFTYFYGGEVHGTVTFENCEFVSDHSYSANFDSGDGNVIFNNCLFDGWSSFGTAITGVEMNGCTFQKSYNYGILRFYQNAELNNCTFADSFEGVDTNQNGTVVKFTDCTGVEGKIFNNGNVVGIWIVDGADISSTVTSW